MADNVIEEFLVGLGVKIDTAGLQKFDNTLKDMGKGIEVLTLSITAATAAAAAAVTAMASNFDQLYWTARNLGSSAGDVKALGYAFSQLGGTAGEAGAAMKSIADFTMSYGKGATGFLTRLGVDPKDIGDAAKTLVDLEGVFQRMTASGDPNDLARATAIAGRIGISPDQLRIMLRDHGEFEKRLRDWAQQAGINFEDATKSSNDFMTSMRALHAEFDLWADSAGVAIIDDLQPKLAALAKWAGDVASGKDLSNIGVEIREIVSDLGKLGAALDHLASSDAAETFAENALSGFDKMIRATTQLTKIVDDISNGNWHQAYIDAITGIAPRGARIPGGAPGNAFGGVWNSLAEWRDSQIGGAAGGSSPGPTTGGAAGGFAPKGAAQTIVNFFKSKGAGDIQAQGLTAMLFSESGLNPNSRNPTSGAYGIAQWLSKDRLAEFKRITGQDLHGSSLAAQLRFVAYELSHRYAGVWEQMKRATSAIDVARIGIHGYEAPDAAGEAIDRRNASRFLAHNFGAVLGGDSRSINFSQTNNYNVSGTDTHAVVQGVGKAQDSANQKMMGAASVYQW